MVYQLRNDLQYSQYKVSGRLQTVIKDPLRLEYFSFAGFEAQLISWLKVPRSATELHQLAIDAGANAQLTLRELQRFLQRLVSDNLLSSNELGAGHIFSRQLQAQQHRPWWTWGSRLISIRFRGIHPRGLLDGLLPLGWVLFHPLTLTAILLWFAWSLLFFVLNLDRLIENQALWQRLFTPSQILPLAVAFVIVKVLHELGHALSCRAQGRECHEMGILLLVFMPCLYCNVSDIWMEPKTRRRILVSGAGILVEMLIASICLPLWLYSRPGEFQFFCFQLFLITSVNTLFVNGNPLLKYDGYFVLSDMLGVPNLADRAAEIRRQWIERWIWGQRDVLTTWRHWPWVAYAIGSQIYRWIMLLSIFTLIVTVFQGWKLPHTGWLIMSLFAASILVGLGAQFTYQALRAAREKTNNHWFRFTIVMLGIALLLTTILALPLPTRVVGTGKTRSAAARFVFASEAGIIHWHMNANQVVNAGQALGEIRNPQLEHELMRAESTSKALADKLRSLEIQRQQGVDNARDLQITQRLIASQQQLLSTYRMRQTALTLTAPATGILRSVAEQQTLNDFDSKHAPTWNGWLRTDNIGAAADRGDILALIETDAPVEIELPIPSDALDRVGVGFRVLVLIPQHGPNYLPGTVREVSLERTTSERSADGNNESLPSDDQYRVTITLIDRITPPREQATAHVLILGPRRVLGRQLLDYLQKNVVLFSPDPQ